MIMSKLTQRKLLEILDYDQDSGLFTWRVGKFAGEHAGTMARDGYWQIGIDYSLYAAHRLAWLYVHGRWPTEQIDHLNHDRSDNRMSNLRETTHIGNGKNRSKQSNNVSGKTGVVWNSAKKKWEARIGGTSNRIHLGNFESFESACRAREKAERKDGYYANHGT